MIDLIPSIGFSFESDSKYGHPKKPVLIARYKNVLRIQRSCDSKYHIEDSEKTLKNLVSSISIRTF